MTTFTVTEQYIPEFEDECMFTEGGCMFLAHEISKLTGWTFCAYFGDFDEPGKPDFTEHAFVQMPDGRYLDVRGVQTAEQMADCFAADELEIRPVPDHHRPELIRSWTEGGTDWYTGRDARRRAAILAREIIDHYS